MDYFCQVAGCRTVPVELGARYTDEEWSQQLMTVSDFISQYITAEVCYTPLFHLQHSSMGLVQTANLLRVISREGCAVSTALN